MSDANSSGTSDLHGSENLGMEEMHKIGVLLWSDPRWVGVEGGGQLPKHETPAAVWLPGGPEISS